MVTGSAVMTLSTPVEDGRPSPTPRTVMSRSVTMPTRRSPSTTSRDPTRWLPSRRPASSSVQPGGTVTGAVRRHSLTSMAAHPVCFARPLVSPEQAVSPEHARGDGSSAHGFEQAPFPGHRQELELIVDPELAVQVLDVSPRRVHRDAQTHRGGLQVDPADEQGEDVLLAP